MDATMREIGSTGVRVPALGFGTAPLGSLPDTFGYSVAADTAHDAVRAILALPDGFIDTSRNYGLGRAETRIGHVVRELGGWPEGRILSTKLDRDMETLRFDGAQARRSLEESLAALAVERVDILHLHDPEHAADLAEITAPGGALDQLMRMKEEGLARAVGLAAGRIEVMMPLLRDWDFDCLITHNRWTLVNRNAGPLIELAQARGVAVLNAAPYAGGALAKGSAHGRYVYQKADAAMLAPVRRVEEICARHGVPVGAAALQASLHDPAVTATICGISRAERVAQTLEWARWPIPQDCRDALAALPAATDDPEASRVYSPG